MFKLLFLLLTIFFLAPVLIHGQSFQFKSYNNKKYKFALSIPTYWTIKYSKEQDGIICIPITKEEKEAYKDCFEGIVFRMDFFSYGLDSTLSEQGYSKVGDTYYTTDRLSDSVKTEKIKGKNWTGIYHNNVCGINCSDNGFHAAGGQCEFLYFSNGEVTVCINTNGQQFDDIILKEIIKSFVFYVK
jgi:hypothetical protein